MLSRSIQTDEAAGGVLPFAFAFPDSDLLFDGVQSGVSDDFALSASWESDQCDCPGLLANGAILLHWVRTLLVA
jgi:hypothetical protein